MVFALSNWDNKEMRSAPNNGNPLWKAILPFRQYIFRYR